jgi:NADH-quinone oxidoreductase subunit H
MAIIPVFVTFAIIPFGATSCVDLLLTRGVTDAQIATCHNPVVLQTAPGYDVGLIFYFAIASLAVYGTTLAGWASYNKWSLLGGLRASSQMMSYEVTMGMAILGAFLVFGTLEPQAMVVAQGPNPIDWGIVKQPLGAVLFFTAAMAETKRTPFDLPEGENEVIGYFVEYSGMRFGIFFLAEFIEVVFLSAVMATVFFGGWQVPFLYTDGFHIGGWSLALPHLLVLILQTTAWGLKVIMFCWFQLLVRWTMPRFRPDQLMSLGWKRLLPVSIANILVTAAVVLAIQAWGAH